jgi:serine/threonine protein kinase
MDEVDLIGAELFGDIGHYVIDKEIAHGGMGSVYLARDLENDHIVAIKEVCVDPKRCREFHAQIREKLVDEMRLLSGLDHPNIPRIYDQFTDRHYEYLVMEFIPGYTLMQTQLQRLHEGKKLEESRVIGWALQILDTLAYLHELPNPIVHRDLKPENMILSPEGLVMLVDFGLVKHVERQMEPAIQYFQAAGTIEYAPPEQYADMDWGIDPRSDIYSLGAVLYYLLSGVLPPRANQRVIPGTLDVTYHLPSIRELNPTVNSHTEQVILKALEIEPEQRYLSARQMRETLLPPRRFILLPGF